MVDNSFVIVADDIASEFFIYDEFKKNDGNVRDRETYDDVI